MLTRLGSRARLLPVVLVVLTALLAPSGAPPSPARAAAPAGADQRAAGLVERLERFGIVDAVRELPRRAPRGARFFRIWFDLPVDHADPDGPRFRLRATLLHRDTNLPMVLATSGYAIRTWDFPSPTEVTRVVGGNQLNLEHRFFKPSRPTEPDWDRQLTIQQSAADQHRVVSALQRIYQRRWISTGISKGGMTMTYHRRFYPGDVDATVAYVAPNDVVDDEDRYAEFLAEVGGADHADCRAALVGLQRRILEDRDWFRDRLVAWGEQHDLHWEIVGSADHAVELTALELYFLFWQYQYAPDACPTVPGAAATRNEVWSWVDSVIWWGWTTDESVRSYVPYYFQAATELGSPAPYEEPVADLLRYPGHDVPASFVPDGLKPLTFDATAMADVDQWVRTSASRMLFVYGEHDPWSAEPFSCGPDGRERQCYRRWVREGTHAAAVASLPDRARRATIARIRAWAGVSTRSAAITAAERRVERGGPDVERRRAVPSG